MKKAKWLLMGLALVCMLISACGDVELVRDSEPRASAPGGLPTPFVMNTFADLADQPEYYRGYEKVDYNRLSEKEYRIRVVIESAAIWLARNPLDEEKLVSEMEKRDGTEKFIPIEGIVGFKNIGDMEEVLRDESFVSDFQANTGVSFNAASYYLPKSLAAEDFMGLVIPLDGKAYFQLSGCQYTPDRKYYAAYWSVCATPPDSPGAEEIAEFYARVDRLKLSSEQGPAGTVYYFSSPNGCAFFEKFDIATNYPATAYLWDQDGVIGIIILPGDHKPENLDMCVLEKHEL